MLKINENYAVDKVDKYNVRLLMKRKSKEGKENWAVIGYYGRLKDLFIAIQRNKQIELIESDNLTLQGLLDALTENERKLFEKLEEIGKFVKGDGEEDGEENDK